MRERIALTLSHRQAHILYTLMQSAVDSSEDRQVRQAAESVRRQVHVQLFRPAKESTDGR